MAASGDRIGDDGEDQGDGGGEQGAEGELDAAHLRRRTVAQQEQRDARHARGGQGDGEAGGADQQPTGSAELDVAEAEAVEAAATVEDLADEPEPPPASSRSRPARRAASPGVRIPASTGFARQASPTRASPSTAPSGIV